jgi:pyruvate carboxylase
VTARGPTFLRALRRLVRVITEFRIRGVKTNIPFLQKLLTHPRFIEGGVSTSFIEEEKSLFELPTGRNRAQKLLQYLADVAVNGSQVCLIGEI